MMEYAERTSKSRSDFIAKANAYIEMPKLIPELLRTFIRRIEVFERKNTQELAVVIKNP